MKERLTRIGLGLACMGTLAIFLWPADNQTLVDRFTSHVAELFAFITALLIWLVIEFGSLSNKSKIHTQSTTAIKSNPHDSIISREIVDFFDDNIRYLLKGVGNSIHKEDYHTIEAFIFRAEQPDFFYENSALNGLLNESKKLLTKLSTLFLYSADSDIYGVVRFRPDIYNQEQEILNMIGCDEDDARFIDAYNSQIYKTAEQLCLSFDMLIKKIKIEHPHALDDKATIKR